MAFQDSLDPALAAELGVDDPELAAAIEASYKIDHPAIEDEELARVLELSRQEHARIAGEAASYILEHVAKLQVRCM